jgi:hypothetical protein
MNKQLEEKLREFKDKNSLTTKGGLAIMLFISDRIKSGGLPFSQPLTDGRGQIKGLSGPAVQSILENYKITRVLAAEGGRTSRGGIAKVQEYVDLMNRLHDEKIMLHGEAGSNELEDVRFWWVEQVKKYFSASPLKVNMDHQQSVIQVIINALAAARLRQKETSGENIEGTVLQYLIGAKLRTVLGDDFNWRNSASTADEPSGRSGDFMVADMAIHSTTAPGNPLMDKCVANLAAGLRPLIICPERAVPVAVSLAESHGIVERIEIFSAETFISSNMNEQGRFDAKAVRQKVREMIEKYNEIVELVENNPSLKIEL